MSSPGLPVTFSGSYPAELRMPGGNIEPGYGKDYSDMSSAEFRAMVESSQNPAAFLASLMKEAQDRFENTINIIAVLTGDVEMKDFSDRVTEYTGAQARADLRKFQKEALIHAQIPSEEEVRRQRASSVIESEHAEESSFAKFLASKTGSAISIVDTTPEELSKGRVIYFAELGRISDRDEFEMGMGMLSKSLTAMSNSSKRKHDNHMHDATTHAFNAFYRLRGLEAAIAENPDFASLAAALTKVINGLQSTLATDIDSLDDVSVQLRAILEDRSRVPGEIPVYDEEEILLRILLERLRRSDDQ